MRMYILGAVIVVLVLWLMWTYNRLVSLRNRVREAWSDIDVQLKRRFDLIPNLVETVRGYMKHEEKVLTEVTEARTRSMNATATEEKAAADNMLSGALKTLFAVSENYPQLRANENFMKLQDELSDTENKIQAARRFYNSVVQDLNTTIQSFPTNMIAGMFGMKESEFFAAANDAERAPVSVKF